MKKKLLIVFSVVLIVGLVAVLFYSTLGNPCERLAKRAYSLEKKIRKLNGERFKTRDRQKLKQINAKMEALRHDKSRALRELEKCPEWQTLKNHNMYK